MPFRVSIYLQLRKQLAEILNQGLGLLMIWIGDCGSCGLAVRRLQVTLARAEEREVEVWLVDVWRSTDGAHVVTARLVQAVLPVLQNPEIVECLCVGRIMGKRKLQALEWATRA